MKPVILAGLSALLLVSATPAVQAQTTVEAMPANADTIGMAVTPFNLVFLAYQGFFEQQGIPKFNGLINRYQSGQVSAVDLVKVAVSMRRLSPETLNNKGYLAAVERQLNSLYNNNGK